MTLEAKRLILLLARAALVAVSGQAAVAEGVVYRFEAVLGAVHVEPPAGSTAARAASFRALTGRFGYERDVPQSAAAGVPGRVAFADYDTGFITVDQVDLGRLRGQVVTRVTDGVAEAEDPGPAISDEIMIGYRAVSTESAIDSVSLQLRHTDAGAFDGIAMPAALRLQDFDSIRLTFSTRIDSLGNRGQAASGGNQVLGLVVFDVTTIERIE